MRVDAVNPSELSPGDIAAWRGLLLAQPELSSPYLTPDWTLAVAARRVDVKVAVFRDTDGQALGFLPVQRPNAVAAMPVGGPVCDYQALIGPADAQFDLTLAVRALGVGRIDLTSGLSETAVGEFLHTEDCGHVAVFADGWDAWCAQKQAAGSKVVSRGRKKLAKLRREAGAPVEVETFSRDAAAFDQLIAWKREQMARTGVHDIFGHDWIAGLVRDTFEREANADFGGAMFVLRVGGQPIAVMHCLQARKALHAWFVAYDPAYADHSPGHILFLEAIRAAADAGFTEMDLGPGDYRFKESLANAQRAVGSGFVGRPGFAAAYKAAQFQMRALVEAMPVGRVRLWPAKAMRRIDIQRGLAMPHDAGRAA